MRAMGWLKDLRKDERGNTLAMMAAAFVPIAGMMGSGLDMSRAYMAKAKLQTACDAAALATRRYMSSGAISQAAKDEGTKFFNFNFPASTMKTTPVALAITTQANKSEVQVTASTTVPTSIMKLFGKRSIAISTACNADQDYVNNDIMLVLDVTGSMYCKAGTVCSYAASNQAPSRLDLLKDAAGNLYDSLKGATGVRIRYGFMPYSMTTNVGASLTATWLRKPSNYHSCSAYNKSGSTNTTCKTWATDIAKAAPITQGCVEERSNVGGAAWPIRIPAAVTQADIDTTGTTTALQWPPYDDTTTTGEYSATADNLARFCPAAATKLATYATRKDFDDKVVLSLGSVGGYTHHEVGLVWGMRFLSPTGMFSASNPTTLNNIRVDRHIVLLTDGEMTVDDNIYSAYGIRAKDDRLSSGSAALAEHVARFSAACARAKSTPNNVTIWVIALDVQDDSAIKPCATDLDHFYASDGKDPEALKKIFTLIGNGIGKLRITK